MYDTSPSFFLGGDIAYDQKNIAEFVDGKENLVDSLLCFFLTKSQSQSQRLLSKKQPHGNSAGALFGMVIRDPFKA